MKLTARLTALIFLAALVARPAFAEDATAPTDYFREGVTARSLGMGNAFVGLADDESALYWNPAGLSLLKGTWVSTTRTTKDEFDINTQSLSLALPSGRAMAGFNLVYSSLGKVPRSVYNDVTDRWEYDGNFFGEDDTAFSLSYAKPYKKNLYLGATLKSVRQKIAEDRFSGWGLDIGAIMEMDNGLRAGLVLQNVGDMDIGTDSVPMNVRLGASTRLRSVNNLLLSAAYESDYVGDSIFSIGAEYEINKSVVARVGSSDGKFSAGLGVNFENFRLDYSFCEDPDSGDLSKLTLGRFMETGKKRPKEEAAKPAPEPQQPKPAPAAEEKKEKEVRRKKTEEKEEKKEEKPKEEPVKSIGKRKTISGTLERYTTPEAPSKQPYKIQPEKGAMQGDRTPGMKSFEEITGGTAPAAAPAPAAEEKPESEGKGEGIYRMGQ